MCWCVGVLVYWFGSMLVRRCVCALPCACLRLCALFVSSCVELIVCQVLVYLRVCLVFVCRALCELCVLFVVCVVCVVRVGALCVLCVLCVLCML